MVQLAGPNPLALIVSHEDVQSGSKGRPAVRRAQPAAKTLQLMVVGRDAYTPSDVRHVPATVLTGQEQIKIIVAINDGPEGVGVIIPGETPVGIDPLVKVGFAIPVRVRQSRQLTLLRDVNPVMDDFESKRFVQSACESAIRSSLHRSLSVLDDIHFTRPGADYQVAVAEPVHPADQQINFARQLEVFD